MCDANDSLTSSTRIWPPSEGAAENFDEVWDDRALLAQYAKVEMQVKAQVDAFRSGNAPLPHGNHQVQAATPSTSTANPPPPSPPPPPASTGGGSSRKKRRHHNKNKRKNGGNGALPANHPPATASVTPFVNGTEIHLQQQHQHHPLCSQCSHHSAGSNTGGGSVEVPTSAIASKSGSVTPSNVAGFQQQQQQYAMQQQQSYPATTCYVPPPIAGSTAAPVTTAPGAAAVYPWIPQSTTFDLLPELLPPPHPPTLGNSNNPARYGVSQLQSCLLPTPVDASGNASQGSSLSASLTNPNGEFNMNLLLRAWYEAGYAMGQAHAEQILGLRPPVLDVTGGNGDCGEGSDDEDNEDGDDEEEEDDGLESEKSKGGIVAPFSLFVHLDNTTITLEVVFPE
ncbi:hypothetical protein Aperf_G00000131217 [Anoplocephala perfoliata]